mmetsp:Transcript_19900/g.60369  ORF Transcript_19900/g.60369 Transcript_19900/m.60369 type:complete len:152 (-) Transcript_19900:617-1072(-)|eukprot:scaffold298455_cov32-Tisochrysis_lutea.AAC.2
MTSSNGKDRRMPTEIADVAWRRRLSPPRWESGVVRSDEASSYGLLSMHVASALALCALVLSAFPTVEQLAWPTGIRSWIRSPLAFQFAVLEHTLSGTRSPSSRLSTKHSSTDLATERIAEHNSADKAFSPSTQQNGPSDASNTLGTLHEWA